MPEEYRSFASYLLFKEILEDSLGHLYRAGELGRERIQRTVWLRVFDSPNVPSSEILQSFNHAHKLASAMHSSNVAANVDHLDEDGVPAIACDYIAGQPLARVFERAQSENYPVPVDNALLILEKIALALAAASTVEIDGERTVHGFVHPGLIFVTNDGEGIVSGFGIADRLLVLADDPASVETIQPYLAPEVLLTRTPNRHGDVYSLGSILFQLLTGKALPGRPEEREEAFAKAQMAYDQQPIPDDIKAILQRTLASRPEDRFSSATDFKKDLDKLLYGGAYSPTTFNLALFMDRLFRSEVDVEDNERAAEADIDVTPYLAASEPEPEAVPEQPGPSNPGGQKGMWIGIGAVGVAAVVAGILFVTGRGPSTPPVPPTPTADEIAAQRRVQEEKMREITQGMVQQMMAEKEAEMRQEFLDRQTKIDELQKRLQESERRAKTGELSEEEKRKQRDLQKQIAAEEEAKKQREDELEAETQRVAEEARRQMAAQQAATATAAAEEELQLAAAAAATQTPTAPSPPQPTVVPTAAPSPKPATEVVKENAFYEPAAVDTLPVILKKQTVRWPLSALRSQREGMIILQATVNASGRVEAVKILRADHDSFGIPQAVTEAVHQYRFKPATKNGVRVTSYATVTERYRFVAK